MALPSSRNTTYSAGSQLLSDDLNDIQDCIVGGSHGTRVRNFSPVIGDGANCEADDSPTALALNAATIAVFPLTFDEGDRISALTFARIGNGTVDLTVVELRVTDADGTETMVAEIAGGISNLGGGAFIDNSLTFVSGAVTLGAGQSLSLVIVSNATGAKIGSIRATYDRPL